MSQVQKRVKPLALAALAPALAALAFASAALAIALAAAFLSCEKFQGK